MARSLDSITSCSEFELAAQDACGEMALAYINGGEADTMDANRADFKRLLFRPRVLVDVSTVDTTCFVMGARCGSPFFLSSVAKGQLVAGADAEAVFVRAAAKAQCGYIVPSLSSLPLSDIWRASAVSAPCRGILGQRMSEYHCADGAVGTYRRGLPCRGVSCQH